MKKKVLNDFKNKVFIDEYFLKEILFNLEENENLEKKYLDIKNTIKNTGFENAANIYSLSDTSKFGGEIGWIKSSRLTKKIKNALSKTKIDEITKPIDTSNGYLILKLNEKREIKEKFNLENELKQQINYETNRQLNQFSLNYYKKLKKNVIINENK